MRFSKAIIARFVGASLALLVPLQSLRADVRPDAIAPATRIDIMTAFDALPNSTAAFIAPSVRYVPQNSGQGSPYLVSSIDGKTTRHIRTARRTHYTRHVRPIRHRFSMHPKLSPHSPTTNQSQLRATPTVVETFPTSSVKQDVALVQFPESTVRLGNAESVSPPLPTASVSTTPLSQISLGPVSVPAAKGNPLDTSYPAITLSYGDHTCNTAGCTDRRGQEEHYAAFLQNAFGADGWYVGLWAAMLTPQQYRSEPDAAWKDTGEAYFTVGKQFRYAGGQVTLAGKLGEINGSVFKALSQLNIFEHTTVGGAPLNSVRVEHPSTSAQPLIGAYESYVAKVASTKVFGINLNANFAQYANLGNALTSFGVGPVLSIGPAENVPLPGGPTLQAKDWSLTAGVLADAVVHDVSVKHLNPYQAHVVVAANVPLGKWSLRAEWDGSLTSQVHDGFGGKKMSQFSVQAVIPLPW